jgi:hypothetical protein
MRIVLVYLGEAVPRYVLQNYNVIKNNFPRNEVWLVLDSEKLFKKIKTKKIQAWLTPRILPDNIQSKTYRDNFWVETRNRFFALEKFHERFNDQSLLHVESDVIILPSFPMNDLDTIDKLLAYPLSSPEVGIASTLYCKTPEGSKYLSQFVLNEIKNYPQITDTEILGKFYQQNPDKTLILRSGPDHFDAYNIGDEAMQISLAGEKSEINSFGIFDASTLGIHLCGTDPRNKLGISKVLDPLDHHFLNVNRCKFEVSNDRINLTFRNETRTLYSLHNHSKKIKLFDNSNLVYFRRIIKRRQSGKYYSFSIRSFFLFCRDYLHLIVRKIKKEIFGVRN